MLADNGDTIPVRQQMVTINNFLFLGNTEYGSEEFVVVIFFMRFSVVGDGAMLGCSTSTSYAVIVLT